MITLHLVGLNPATKAIAHSAFGIACQSGEIKNHADVSAAQAAKGAADTEVILLHDPSARDLAVVTSAMDSSALPRWAVVVIGEEWAEEWAEVVPPETDAALLARAIKSALTRHRLQRERDRARGDLWTMARRLTHDMRTPIGCVLTAAEAMQESLPPGDEDIGSLVQSVHDSALEMARLVERVSVVAKAGADAMPRERVDMAVVFSVARDRLSDQASAKNATISEAEDWPVVRGVSTWCETIWRDLLANAIEHAGDSPKIEAGWSRETGECRFWVRDDGVGVPVELRSRLFQPFHLLHELNAGQGLGLAIVRRLVELQGGRVGYEALPEGGSLFYFALPSLDSVVRPNGSVDNINAHAST